MIPEWTQDCCRDAYQGAPSDGSAWTSGCSEGSRRVASDGSSGIYALDLCSADRGWFATEYRSDTQGAGEKVTPLILTSLPFRPGTEPVIPGREILTQSEVSARRPQGAFRRCEGNREFALPLQLAVELHYRDRRRKEDAARILDAIGCAIGGWATAHAPASRITRDGTCQPARRRAREAWQPRAVAFANLERELIRLAHQLRADC